MIHWAELNRFAMSWDWNNSNLHTEKPMDESRMTTPLAVSRGTVTFLTDSYWRRNSRRPNLHNARTSVREPALYIFSNKCFWWPCVTEVEAKFSFIVAKKRDGTPTWFILNKFHILNEVCKRKLWYKIEIGSIEGEKSLIDDYNSKCSGRMLGNRVYIYFYDLFSSANYLISTNFLSKLSPDFATGTGIVSRNIIWMPII